MSLRFGLCAGALTLLAFGAAAIFFQQRSPAELAADSEPAGADRATQQAHDNRLRPVPELVDRQTLSRMALFPGSVRGFRKAEEIAAPLREKRERGPSGLWRLTSLYKGFDEALKYQFDLSFQSFNANFAAWEAEGPKTPTPYLLKAAGLRLMANEELKKLMRTPAPPDVDVARFRDLVGDLAETLESSKAIAAADPQWYALMISAMRYQCAPFPQVMAVLSEGTKKFPDYYQLYFGALDAGLECGGKPKTVIDTVIDLAIERTHNLDGSAVYARAFWYLTQIYGDGILVSDLIDWKRMQASMHDILHRYPDAWNTNNLARFACVARDAATTRELMPAALELPVMQVWGKPEFLAGCAEWAASQASNVPTAGAAP